MKFPGRVALAAAAVWFSSAAFALTEPSAPGDTPSALSEQQASDDALYAEHWIRAEDDNHDGPFAIVDKKAARIFVFGPAGRLEGSSPVLLGLARGDAPVPGAGAKDPSQLLPYERKTPAGRFQSVPGRNLNGEAVVWVDYDTGIAIHRVRPGPSQARRLHNLTTAAADDKRMSLGCVVVPEEFFSAVVLPTLGHAHGTIYVLPEDGPVQAMFHAEPVPAAAVPAPAQERPAAALAEPVARPAATTAAFTDREVDLLSQ
jgi:hypothetical protein